MGGLFANNIFVNRFNRALQKLMGTKGSQPAPTLAGDIQPSINFVFDVADRYLHGWSLYGVGDNPPATAANNTGIRLRNPSAKNVVLVVYKLTLASSIADGAVFLEIGSTAVDLTNIVAAQRMDARGPSSSNAVYSSTFNAAVLGTPIGRFSLAINPPGPATNTDIILTEDQGIPILPGDALQVRTAVVNIGLSVELWWRERFLEESERT